jgi:hypothetical protein
LIPPEHAYDLASGLLGAALGIVVGVCGLLGGLLVILGGLQNDRDKRP